MADHIVRYKEVPKGQKMQYLWDYYRWPVIIAASLIVFFSYIAKVVFFTPEPDMSILMTSEYLMFSDEIKYIEEALEEKMTAPKKPDFKIVNIQYDPNQMDYDANTFLANSVKLNAELSSADSYIQISDEQMFNYLKSEDLVSQFDEIGSDKEGDIKISLGSFIGDDKYSEFYITLRPRENSQITDEKSSEKYEYAVNFIKSVLEKTS